jgi:hypothetical protein
MVSSVLERFKDYILPMYTQLQCVHVRHRLHRMAKCQTLQFIYVGCVHLGGIILEHNSSKCTANAH